MAKKPEKPMPDQDYLRSLLNYDPDRGTLTWIARPRTMFASERIFLSWNAKMAGKPAFTCIGGNGYLFGSIWGKHYTAHRIIFKMMTGRDPVGVDHIDGDKLNNRWNNLREADQRLNARNSAMPRNNSSGHIGVYWFKDRSKWFAAIKAGGKSKNLGYFDKIEDAIAARKAAEARLGFHENHGRRADV